MRERYGKIILLAALVAAQTRAEVGEALNGVAGIIGAISPIAMAAAEASAAKAIAASNGMAAVATAAIQADTSKYLATAQAEVALAQTAAAAEINRINNDGQTERLGMQLAELRAAREDAMRAEREKRAIEVEYNRERIELAKKQADDNLKLAQATLQAQLVQAGLVSGFKYKDSSKGLTVTSSLTGGGTPLASTSLGNPSPMGTGTAFMSRQGQVPRTETSRRLLAAAMNGGNLSSPASSERSSLIPSLTGGSTPMNRYRAAAPKSDLSAFRASLGMGEPRLRSRSPASEKPLVLEGGHSSRGAAGF